MNHLYKLVHAVTLIFFLLPLATTAQAKSTQTLTEASSGVKFELIGHWSPNKLNNILQQLAPDFFGVTVKYSPATNGVSLYRITYPSVIPERGNQPTIATGLLAIPDIDSSNLSIVSYQHGTVYGKQQVPSFPEQSTETALMIAQFAGQGYIVIGADYFGLGKSTEPEGYMVKASHQQSSYDMLVASKAVLSHMQINTRNLFLAGWSQGGFVTMAFLEKLEKANIPVQGAVTASAPTDIFMTLSGFLNFPRANDADWVPTLFILSSFSFEHYYGIPGLARSIISEDYFEVSRKAYERQQYDPADIPTDLRKLIKKEYFDSQFFAASAYGRLIADTQAYRWVIKSLVKNYYGEADEAITIGLGRLPMVYQQAIGNGNPQVEAISTGLTTHRGTFATAVPLWKIVFDDKNH